MKENLSQSKQSERYLSKSFIDKHLQFALSLPLNTELVLSRSFYFLIFALQDQSLHKHN